MQFTNPKIYTNGDAKSRNLIAYCHHYIMLQVKKI